MSLLRQVSALALVAITAAGCGRDVLTFGKGLSSELRIEPTQLELYLGQAFEVEAVYGTATQTRNITSEAGLTWSVDPQGIATIATDGTGMAVASGRANVIATFDGVQAEAQIVVLDANLVDVKIEPDAISVAVGQTQALKVTGTLSDGTSLDLSSGASGTTYANDTASLFIVNEDGVISGVARGTGIVRVTHGAFILTVGVEVTTTSDAIVALRFEPPRMTLAPFEGREFSVIGRRSSGTEFDAIAAGILQLQVDGDRIVNLSPGFIESLGRTGTTRISARVEGVVATAEVEVVGGPLELVGLEIQPEFLQLRVGERAQLRVIGTYSDGSSVDLSPASRGTGYRVESGPAGPISVTANGQVEGRSAGEALVVATNQGLSATVFVEVEGRQLVNLEVTPREILMALNQQVQLTVTGFYDDGSVQDLTPASSGTTYQPPLSGIANVSSNGVVQALRPGDDILFVDHQGFQVPVFISVQPSMNAVISVRIVPNFLRLQSGQPFFGLDVIALFSDGSESSVVGDPGLNITSDDPNIALWDGIAVVGLQPGMTVLRATYQGVTGTARVQVEGTTSVLLGIQLQAPTQVAVGQTLPFSVAAFFSDGSIIDVTLDPQLMLTVDAPSLLSANLGLLSGLAPGQTTLSAFYQGQQDTQPILVTTVTDPIVAIRFLPAALTLNVGQTGQSRVIATRQSGIEQNISNDPQLTVSASGPITISNGPADISVTGQSAGNASVTARYQGLSTTLRVTVQSVGPTLDAIQIIAPGQMVVGTTEMFAVIGVFSDGSISDLTNDPGMTLTVAPMIVIIGNHQITAQQAGTTQLTATYQGMSVQATVLVTAGNDTLVSLTWQPTTLTIPLNQRGTAVLIATFSSGAVVDVTFDSSVNYNFSGPVLPLPGANGIDFIAQSPGNASATATYQGMTAQLNITVTSSGPTVTGITLTAPANLDLGSNGAYSVNATYSDGSNQDVTNDPGLMVFVENPTIFSAAGGILTPIQVGTTRLAVTFDVFTAQRSINVVNNNPYTSIRFQPSTLNLSVGQIGSVQVIGRRANGSTDNLTAQVMLTTQGPLTLGPAGTNLDVLGNAPGAGSVQASFNGLSATLTVTILGAPVPTITSLNPDALAVGSPAVRVNVNGTLFQSSHTVTIDGVPVPTSFISGTQLQMRVASALVTLITDLDIQVVGPSGSSNTVQLPVGLPPSVSSYTPDTVVAGSSIDVVLVGSGLTSITPVAMGLSAVLLSSAPDGSLARIRITASSSVMAGPYTLVLNNPWGTTSVVINVTTAMGQMDLIVNNGQTVTLSGTNVFDNIIVNTGGQIVGTGLSPLALIATGDITIRGSIDVSGSAGEDGFTNPAQGGAAGPGGAGGGGGADGSTNSPAAGGAGSPAGLSAGPSAGRNTVGGDGGGVGAGSGATAAGGCGQGGGGGALGGNGGSGGGALGTGTGGEGGVAGSGSQFGAGTGGGGGGTCGGNSGGGGGGGGGTLILQVALGGTISIQGQINANGGDGGGGFSGTGGGAGGAGGRVEVTAPGGTITVVNTIFARGGAGGDADFSHGGGGGSGGIITIDAAPGGTINSSLGLLDLTGGLQGSSLGLGFSGRSGAPGTSNISP